MKRLRGFLATFSFLSLMLSIKTLGASDLPVLKIGLIPSGDSFPSAEIAASGADRKKGYRLEVIYFSSAMERDTALISGRIDGANGDLIGASLAFHAHGNIKVVTQHLGGKPIRMAALVAAPKLKDLPLKDFASKPLALSPHSALGFVADGLIKKHMQIDPASVPKTTVNDLALRFSLLKESKVDWAALPEPFVSMALAAGCRIVIEDQSETFSHAVMVFNDEALQKKKDLVQKFLASLADISKSINSSSESYRESIAKVAKIPEQIKETFPIYQYNADQKPSEQLMEDVQTWLVNTGKLKEKISYARLIL